MKLRVVTVGAALLFSSQAYAQSNSTLAETLYQDGKRLMQEKKYAEACPKLAESQKLEPATGTVLNLAACYEAWGKHATAWTTYNDALTAARREGQDYRVKYAEEQLKIVESKLTRLQVDLASGVEATGLEVSLDGRALPSAAFGTPMPVDPGVHVITAKAPGKKSLRIEVKADSPNGIVKTILPALADDSPNAPAASPAAPASAPAAASAAPSGEPATAAPEMKSATVDAGESGGRSNLLISGLIVAGLGAVGIGVGTVFYVKADEDNSQAEVLCQFGPNRDQCFNDQERQDHTELVESAEQNATIAYVGFGLGAAALATGGVLTVMALSSKSKQADTAHVSPLLGPGLAGAGLSGRF
jgi:hypothetical protein